MPSSKVKFSNCNYFKGIKTILKDFKNYIAL